ncbi:MAG: right-handed parallel beta-helix repeat-containing protein [Planctomycetota bacterium]
MSAERWVGPGGSNAASGTTVGDRWAEFTFAVKNLEPGDTLNVLDGDYVIRQEVDNYNGIASVRRTGFVRLDGWTDAVTTIRAVNAGAATVRGNIHVKGSFITIEGLNVYGDEGNIEPGFLIEDSHHVTIRNNQVAYCGGGGINTNHCDTLRIIGNRVHTNCLRNPQQHSGISIYQPIAQVDPENRYWSIEIRRNICYDNVCWAPGQLGHTDGNGIIVDDYFYTQPWFLKDYHYEMISGADVYSKRTLVEANLCTYNGGAGIRSYLGSQITIKNNTLVGNNRLFYYWEDGGYDVNGYYNAGNMLLENSFNCYILNNICQSTYKEHAPFNSNYAASDQWGGDNLWENNLLTSKLGYQGLWNNFAIDNQAFYGDPAYVDEANYDYRSNRGFGLGKRWDGHVYEDLYGNQVEGGGRVDLGAIQLR